MLPQFRSGSRIRSRFEIEELMNGLYAGMNGNERRDFTRRNWRNPTNGVVANL
jgi:hypothetical protein